MSQVRDLPDLHERAYIDVEVTHECSTSGRGEPQCTGSAARGQPFVGAEAAQEGGTERSGEVVAALSPVKTTPREWPTARLNGFGVNTERSQTLGPRWGERDPAGCDAQCAIGLQLVVERNRDGPG